MASLSLFPYHDQAVRRDLDLSCPYPTQSPPLSFSLSDYIELSRVKWPQAWLGKAWLGVALSCAKFANFLIKISAP